MYYKLIRKPTVGNAVYGTLYRVSHDRQNNERLTPVCNTLENDKYKIPPLIYLLVVSLSPKFKRLLPYICAVPQRIGIRLHVGTKPEHSKGCILVPNREIEQQLTQEIYLLNNNREEVRIEICNPHQHM